MKRSDPKPPKRRKWSHTDDIRSVIRELIVQRAKRRVNLDGELLPFLQEEKELAIDRSFLLGTLCTPGWGFTVDGEDGDIMVGAIAGYDTPEFQGVWVRRHRRIRRKQEQTKKKPRSRA